jgi:arylsulfatase A-like enzyme
MLTLVFMALRISAPRTLITWRQSGIRFTSFYAQPLCGPSRAALLTGSYPVRIAEPNNVKKPNTTLAASEVTIAELLQGNGYATALVGKWHLAGDGAPWDYAPPPLPPGREEAKARSTHH